MNAMSHHILVVEDDPVGRETLAAYLRRDNHRVSEAADGDAMRRIFARGDVDVVMLDINLPNEDGLSLLREIRRQSQVGIIMVTGRQDAVDRIVALEFGADDYVTKPYNMRESRAPQKFRAPRGGEPGERGSTGG